MSYQDHANRTKPHLLTLLCGVILACAAAGCLTIEQMAPPVSPAFNRAQANRVTLAFMQRGRDVYLQDCTRCHSPEPIVRYSQNRWQTILDRMARRAKLDDVQTTALRAYVLTAHDVLATSHANE